MALRYYQCHIASIEATDEAASLVFHSSCLGKIISVKQGTINDKLHLKRVKTVRWPVLCPGPCWLAYSVPQTSSWWPWWVGSWLTPPQELHPLIAHAFTWAKKIKPWLRPWVLRHYSHYRYTIHHHHRVARPSVSEHSCLHKLTPLWTIRHMTAISLCNDQS